MDLDNNLEKSIIKYLQGNATDEETKSLLEWINKNPENKLHFLEIKDLWDTSSHFSVAEAETDMEWVKLQSKLGYNFQDRIISIYYRNRENLSRVYRVAAIFIVAYMMGWLTLYLINDNKDKFSQSQTPSYNQITAPLGSKSQVLLPDGSKVWLNAGSTIRYNSQFSKASREVYLQGEAYFDVKKDMKRPFFVKTQELNIKVHGTSFNVKSYPEEGTAEATLVKGSISIERLDKGLKPEKEVVLVPNQKAIFIKKKGRVLLSNIDSLAVDKNLQIDIKSIKDRQEQLLVANQVETDIYTAWKDERLIFRNETFESLVVRLERWYGVKINILDEDLKKIHYTGTIEKETINDVLKIIKFTMPIDYSISHNIVNLRKSNKK